jgi:diacylglycerol kinase family enzyme
LASQSWIKGSLKYVTAGLKALMSSKRVKVVITGEDYNLNTSTELIALANGKWEGGKYLISSESDHSDGKFELLVLKQISKLRLAYEFVKLSLGGKLSDEIVHKSAHSRLTVKADKRLQIHADGEVISAESRFDISLISGAVQVIEARV